MPSVNQLSQDFKAQGLEVLLIAFRESPAEVARVARDRGYTARVLLDASGDVTGRLYGVFGPPTVYLVDREGRLAARAVGPRQWASPAARTLITDLLRAR